MNKQKTQIFYPLIYFYTPQIYYQTMIQTYKIITPKNQNPRPIVPSKIQKDNTLTLILIKKKENKVDFRA